MQEAPRTTLQPGDAAPDFTVSAVQTGETISLRSYRGRSPLLLALFRGVFCPFCRRAIVQMAASSASLQRLGIESLAIVATELDNARLYYKFRPTKLLVAADPDLATHRSYGVPRLDPTPELMSEIEALRINPTGELPYPMNIEEASRALDAMEHYEQTATDQREAERHFAQLMGQFMIDREGIIRWVNIEGASGGPAAIGRFPSLAELLAAAAEARCLPGSP